MFLIYYLWSLQHLFHSTLCGLLTCWFIPKTHLSVGFTWSQWVLAVRWVLILKQLLFGGDRVQIFKEVWINRHPYFLVVGGHKILPRLFGLSLNRLYYICTLSQCVQSAWIFREFIHRLWARCILHSRVRLIGSHFRIMHWVVWE